MKTVSGNGDITVSWTASAGAASHHLRYRILQNPPRDWGPAGGGDYLVLGAAETQTTLANREVGRTYLVQVGAKHDGVIYWSQVASQSVVDTPTITGVQGRDGILEVGIGHVSSLRGTNAHRLHYRESSQSDPNPNRWLGNYVAEQEDYRILGLTNGTTYEIRLTATFPNGVERSAVTEGTPFAKPADIWILNGSGKLEARWTAAAGAGSYTVRYRKETETAWQEVTGETGVSREIAGLDNETIYVVQVGTAHEDSDTILWARELTGRPGVIPAAPTVTPLACGLRVEGQQLTGVTADYTAVFREIDNDGNAGAWDNSYSLNKIINGGLARDVNLYPGQRYEARIGAKFPGSGGGFIYYWGPETEATSLAGEPPDTVVVTSSTSGSTISLNVIWAKRPGSSGHSVRYRLSDDGTGSPGAWTTEHNQSSPYSKSGLDSGAYDVQVATLCLNSAGTVEEFWSSNAGNPTLTAPSALRAQSRSTTSIELVWASPAGISITGKEACYRLASSGGKWTKETVTVGENDVHTVTGLAAGETYQFRVRHQTAAGWSPYSEIILVNTALTPKIKLVKGGELQLIVTWDDVSGGADSWTLRYRKGADFIYDGNLNGITTITEVTSPYTISVPTSGTYRVRLGAVKDGSTFWSASKSASALVKAVAVNDLVVTPGDGQLVANWTRTGGSEDIEALWVRQVGHTAWNDFSYDPITSPQTITKVGGASGSHPALVNGTTYEVRVSTSFTRHNPTQFLYSEPVAATPGKNPHPANVKAVAGDAKLAVSWNDASGATSHSVRHRQSDDGTGSPGSWTTATSASKPYDITGLTNGTEYDVQVGAVHSTGTPPTDTTVWSPTIKGTPAKGASGMMGPPRGLAVDPGNGVVGMTWQPPGEETEDDQPPGNGVNGHGLNARSVKGTRGQSGSSDDDDSGDTPAPTGYEVGYTLSGSEWSAGGSQQVSGLAASITGLENGKAYAFRVRALADGEPGEWSETLTATPEAPDNEPGEGPSYEGVESPALSFVAGEKIAPVTLPAASGGSGALTYSVAPALANGLAFDAATRQISGTPAAAADAVNYTLTAADEDGNTAELAFTVTVTGDATAPTVTLAAADGVESPVAGAFGIAIAFSEPVTGFALADLTVANGAASDLAGSDAAWTATVTPDEGFSGNLTVDLAAGAVEDAAGNGNEAAPTLTVAVVAPLPKPANVANATTAETKWKSLDVTFDAPPAWADWVAANTQIRVLGMKEGAKRTGWMALKTVTVDGSRVHASTKPRLAIGRVYEVELRLCGETVSDAGCSEASDMVHSATPASATALKLAWSIGNIGGKKNLQAAYEIGYAKDTSANEPEKLLAEVPDFGAKEAEVDGLEAGTEYRLFVRSAIDWQGARLFASNWTSATASTASDAESLAGEALKRALAGQARQLLEDASDAIGRRMSSGGAGSDLLSAFAGLLGGQGPGGCALEDSIEDCVTGGDSKSLAQTHGGFGGTGDRFGFGGSGGTNRSYSLSDLSGLMKSQGFAISLNRPLPTMGFAQEEAPADDAGMQLTLWGQGAGGGSDGAMFWGMDASMGERWMTGIAFAESGAIAASGLKHGDARVSGFAESEVTAVYPYARGRFASGLELWSLAGWGKGRVDSRWTGFAPGSGPVEIDLAGGLGFSLGMAGAEQVLYEADGLSVSAVGDAGWSRLAVSGGTADGVSATVTRTRVAVSGRYAEGGLASSLRIGGRVDGGDGETASGAEVSGEVRHAWGRWEVGAQGRWYTAETTGAGFGERGVRAAVGLRAKADGTGLAFALSPGWGASGAQQGESGLLGTLDGDAAEQEPAAHLDGRVSWGIQVPGLIAHREMLRPYAEFSLTDGASHQVRTGVALEGPVRINLALEHRKDAAGPAEHGIMLRLDVQF